MAMLIERLTIFLKEGIDVNLEDSKKKNKR